MDAKERIEELRKIINYHSKKYYDEDKPEISDYEYDMLMNELKALEKEHPELITPDSPTQKVGGHVKEDFAKVTHEVPLQSLQDIFSFEELYEMIAEKRQEHQSVSMKQLLENLNKTSKKTGGFYCTFELFKHIYEVSLLSAKRDHKDYYIILFELQGCHDLEKQIEIMNRLKNIIMRSLRSSDIFTKVNLTQFALLISCVEEHNTQLVIRRITSLFYKRYARNLYQLSYEVVAVNDMIEHKGEKLL